MLITILESVILQLSIKFDNPISKALQLLDLQQFNFN